MVFKPGESGNNDGRPKGTGHRQQLFKALVGPHQEKLFGTAIQMALDGNEAMLRLLLERMLPAKPSDDAVDIDIPSNLKKTNGLLVFGENIFKALSQGTLTPQQAKEVMRTIEIQRKNIETSEIVERVVAMERVLNKRKNKEF